MNCCADLKNVLPNGAAVLRHFRRVQQQQLRQTEGDKRVHNLQTKHVLLSDKVDH